MKPWVGVFLLGFAAALVAIGFGGWMAMRYLGHDTVPSWRATRKASSRMPWGTLEAQRIPLVNTEDIDLAANHLMSPPRWFFGCPKDRLVQYLMSADLRARERGILLNQRYWTILTNGCEIAPPESLVLSLGPESRARIYSVLAQSDLNLAQRTPYRFTPSLFRTRLQSIGLEGFEIARLEQLSYTNARSLCIADLGIAKKIMREHSFEEFMEMIYSTPAYTVRLRVSKEDDTDELARYWGRGGREKQIAPLLRSLANTPGGSGINIIALLPEFPRNRVYTFPSALNDAQFNRQDCAFTALNFFNRVPDTNYLNPDFIAKALRNDYVSLPPDEPPTFGDLMQLVDQDGNIFHMSVYLAEEFVFTKNGVNPTEPWTIMRLQDMMTLYFANRTDGSLLVMRKLEFMNTATSTPGVQPKAIDDWRKAGL
jgi:hypothetical protein